MVLHIWLYPFPELARIAHISEVEEAHLHYWCSLRVLRHLKPVDEVMRTKASAGKAFYCNVSVRILTALM